MTQWKSNHKISLIFFSLSFKFLVVLLHLLEEHFKKRKHIDDVAEAKFSRISVALYFRQILTEYQQTPWKILGLQIIIKETNQRTAGGVLS